LEVITQTAGAPDKEGWKNIKSSLTAEEYFSSTVEFSTARVHTLLKYPRISVLGALLAAKSQQIQS
jgi:hypothetical protein